MSKLTNVSNGSQSLGKLEKIIERSLITGAILLLVVGCDKKDSTAIPSSEPSRAAESAQPVPKSAAEALPLAKAASNQVAAISKTEVKLQETIPANSNLAIALQAPKVEAIAPQATNVTRLATQASASLASLSQDQVFKGLQDALGKGLQQAIARLGHEGGFLTNLSVRIPMPEKLLKVENALRAMKQDKLADDFVTTMNHAAEQAVPEASGVFLNALKQMSIEDAKSILSGPDDAATQYFQKTTQTNLYAKFYPIVQKATETTGTTAAYKNLLAKANASNLTQRLGTLGSAISGSLLDKDSLDIDAYVTNKSLEGLFKMVAEEEKRVRQNPAARTTELLQTVFGALKK